MNFSQAVHSAARLGASRIPASAMPTRARFRAVQPSATRMRTLIDVSSRKSMLAANNEAEPITRATVNSMLK